MSKHSYIVVGAVLAALVATVSIGYAQRPAAAPPARVAALADATEAVAPGATSVAEQNPASRGAARSTPSDGAARATVSADAPAASAAMSVAEQNLAIGRYCLRCHNDITLTGGLSLESYDAARAAEQADITERMLRKLRAGMMPPITAQRPDAETYAGLIEGLSRTVDDAYRAHPDPGGRSFQRLNRAEYERSVGELLGLQIDPAAYLPPDTISAGFDNIADVQGLSATVMEGYLRAAGEVARLALGDPEATASETTYEVPRYASQRERVEGAPFGTRGGISVLHTFPADGVYVFRLSLQHESTGNLFGNGRGALHTAAAPENIEVSIDGEPVALLEVDRWGHRQEAASLEMRTAPIAVTAGPKRVTAAFLRRSEGPVEDLTSPHEWSLADKKIGYSYGVSSVPHLRDLAIRGPEAVTGVSDNPIRDRLLSCRPHAELSASACADRIIGSLAERAYRRELTAPEATTLAAFFAAGNRQGGFEAGVRAALTAILASPDFIFRFEEPTSVAGPGNSYRLSDADLATRLSFFLWGGPPDDELRALARQQRLSAPGVLDAQLDRMLADPRIESLGSRFAAQWLRLQDLDIVHPDALRFPDYYQQLADSMRRETELFFSALVREDRSMLELLTADFSFVDERLARHYGIDGVVGNRFQRVALPPERRGVLGHGSILVQTSHANRTSPVLRGKWVMEVLFGTPPPPPPPNVPELDEPDAAADSRRLSVRQQMEAHRANPACMSCHQVIDPLGLALENFDVTGVFRIKDRGVDVNAAGELYDGSMLDGPAGLRAALLKYTDAVVTNFTVNLMSYALGRRIEYPDMPAVRAVVGAARDNNYRMSSFIDGIVNSPAFQNNRQAAPSVAAPAGTGGG